MVQTTEQHEKPEVVQMLLNLESQLMQSLEHTERIYAEVTGKDPAKKIPLTEFQQGYFVGKAEIWKAVLNIISDLEVQYGN